MSIALDQTIGLTQDAVADRTPPPGLIAGDISGHLDHLPATRTVWKLVAMPTAIPARAVGFVYFWSRFSAIFTAFLIAAVLKNFGVTGVFVCIAAAMGVVMLATGVFGLRTRNVALEDISH
jgi:hypothetical protein